MCNKFISLSTIFHFVYFFFCLCEVGLPHSFLILFLLSQERELSQIYFTKCKKGGLLLKQSYELIFSASNITQSSYGIQWEQRNCHELNFRSANKTFTDFPSVKRQFINIYFTITAESFNHALFDLNVAIRLVVLFRQSF